MNPALTRMMAEETAEDAAAANEVCIEDEAIEECILAEWPAGQLKVRTLLRAKPRTTRPHSLLIGNLTP